MKLLIFLFTLALNEKVIFFLHDLPPAYSITQQLFPKNKETKEHDYFVKKHLQ